MHISKLAATLCLSCSGFLSTFGASAQTTVSLVAGWNLVGNGYSGSLDVATTFNSMQTTVWKWNPAVATWGFYTSLQADSGAAYAVSKGYNFLTTINGGEGFWVHARTDFTIQLPVGSAVSSASFLPSLPSGWSLISIGDNKTPSQFNAALSITSPPQGVIPINITTLWAWDGTQYRWYFYAPSLEAQGGTVLTDYIAGKGYLDFTSANKTLGTATGFWVNRP